eukprot:CAMPEP_0115199384 /NCGR_PEP_ID=MMETSP0270-20121206/16594_1 /TAXON_ID=71861 /ORGANISM="Scrippsiella trochoidea, Strain CCMP3099" /LENGTH=64 /DNA_ID=CAMNT_0002612787 /DNA_START=599 /DNA_END=790 /DNA_ORIENTATION=+
MPVARAQVIKDCKTKLAKALRRKLQRMSKLSWSTAQGLSAKPPVFASTTVRFSDTTGLCSTARR